MKRKLLVMLFGITLAMGIFIGCSTKSEDNNELEKLSLFLSSVENAGRIEYSGVETIVLDGIEKKQYSNVEYKKSPYSFYRKLGIPSDNTFTMVENKLIDKGKTADYLMKSTLIEGFQEDMLSIDDMGNFAVETSKKVEPIDNTVILEDEEKDLMIKYYDQNPIVDIISIAQKNLSSFKESQEKIDNVNYMRYDGIFTVESILERYSVHGSQAMEARLDMLNIKSSLRENPTIEELKNHIMTLHEGVDIAEGIYELVYAEKPVSVSFWIPKIEGGCYKIQIDYSNAYSNKQNKLYNLDLKNSKVKKNVEYMILGYS